MSATPNTDRVVREMDELNGAPFYARDIERMGLHGAGRCRHVLYLLRDSERLMSTDRDAAAAAERDWTEVFQLIRTGIRIVEQELRDLES